MSTHVGILSVDTGDKVRKTMFLLVFIGNEKSLRVEIAMMDLEASFVGNPVAIPESRSTRKVIAGHIMESAKAERLGRKEIIYDGDTLVLPVVVVVVGNWPVRRIWAEKWFRPGK